MGSNSKLSIVIPTFNRALYLDCFIKSHLNQLIENHVNLIIVDNASTDKTKSVVKSWQKENPFIEYIENTNNIGPIKNVYKALSSAKSEYVWLIGDTYLLPVVSISYVLKKLSNNNLDFVVFNLVKRGPTKEILYIDHNKVLSDLGAVCSCLSVTIFRKDIIDSVRNFKFSNETRYPHTLTLFHALVAMEKFKLLWLGHLSVRGLEIEGSNKNSWLVSKSIFEIGLRNWQLTINSLPDKYSIRSKRKAIIDEFNVIVQKPTILYLRRCKLFNFSVFKKYRNEFKLCHNYNEFKYLVISLSPILLIRIFEFLVRPKGSIKDFIPEPVKTFFKKK